MKQIKECLDKAFEHKLPALSRKWKGFILDVPEEGEVLYLYHYHHLILACKLSTGHYLYEWWEKRADKRGLDSAKWYLEQHFLQGEDINEAT